MQVFLELGLTVNGLALELHVPATRIDEIAHERRRFTAETALRPSRAIELLKVAVPYELGLVMANLEVGALLYPVYVRGQAYLLLHDGNKAALEFQKFLDHRSLVANNSLFVLAHLGLARAYAMQGDTAKAKAAYQDFLTLWKDADPDIPIFIAAKTEYAKLQ